MSAPSLGGERWQRAEALFHELVGVAGDERRERLAAACGDDAELRTLVERLLAADAESGRLQSEVQGAIDAASHAVTSSHLDRRLGPYRLVEVVGHGGMGTVYAAERVDQEFRQRVAVKVVRGYLDVDSVRRFRNERQILASLQHPHIAALLDGGTTDEGMPYLVMEFIEGTPIDRYVLDRSLPVGERLKLFLTICDAVGHAHRQLVVHRDLKPANILVTEAGVPKLLDFGIAKLLETDDPALAGMTATGVRLLTPDYAAPEQVRGERISTATDIYALGVVLFELITNQRPHRFKTMTAQEIERVVCDTEPPHPRSLAPQIADDLAVIALTAMAKEPGRRYATVEAFADDLRRYLEGRPILARPSTWRYRAGRFAARHRWGVAAASALVALFLVFAVVFTLQAARIARERDRAEVERDAAEAVSEFLVELFEVSDPEQARGSTVTARELLDRGSSRVQRQLAAQPAVQSRLMDTIGHVYQSLGLYDQAAAMLEAALATRDATLGRNHAETARTLEGLAETYRERAEYERAEALHREALAIKEAVLGPNDRSVASSLNDLGLTLMARGRHAEAEPYLQRAIAVWRSSQGVQDPDVAVGLSNLAQLFRRESKYADAEPLLRESLAIRQKTFGEPHPLVANSLAQLGQLLQEQGRLDEAREPLRQALAMRQAVYESDHPLIATAANNLAALLHDLGDLQAAEPLYRQALDGNRARLGPTHPEVAVGLNNLATLLEDRGQLDTAIGMFREALDIRRRTYGDQHPAVARGLNNLARVLIEHGDLREAAPLAEQALAMRRTLLGDRHVETAGSLVTLGMLRQAQGRRADAEAAYRQALAEQRRLVGTHPSVATTLLKLARVLQDDGKLAEAEPLAREALEIREARLPANHWHRLEAQQAVALVARHRDAQKTAAR